MNNRIKAAIKSAIHFGYDCRNIVIQATRGDACFRVCQNNSSILIGPSGISYTGRPTTALAFIASIYNSN